MSFELEGIVFSRKLSLRKSVDNRLDAASAPVALRREDFPQAAMHRGFHAAFRSGMIVNRAFPKSLDFELPVTPIFRLPLSYLFEPKAKERPLRFTSRSSLRDIEQIRVGVIDTEDQFIEEVALACEKLGIDQFHCGKSVFQAEGIVYWDRFDIIFLEINPRYDNIWQRLGMASRPVVIASTNERSGRAWLSTLRRGAHRVIDKRQAPMIIDAVLKHLLDGEDLKSDVVSTDVRAG